MRQRPASFLALLLILLSLAAMTILAVTPEAAAQERRNLLEMLFGRRTPPPVYDNPPEYREPGRMRKRPSKPSARRRPPSERPVERPMRSRAPAATDAPSPRAAAAPATAPVEKTPDARTVLVVGDFIGSGLAEGLAEAFAETPDIRVASRTNGSSGFVRTDHYDWGTNIKTLLEEEKPAAVVVMIGANDRQPMAVDGVTYAPRTPQWTTEYTRRVDNFVNTVKSAGYPLIWVGQPPFKLRSLSQDMLALNEIYQTATEKAGGNFADVWDGFVDENGNFVLSGVDINGQTARLRANDGINITRAGKRKLAFYAEKPLRQLLGDTTPAALPGPPAGPQAPTVAAPVKIDRIAPVSLKELDLQGSNELMGAHIGSPTTPAKPASTDGTDVKPQPGRADDFSWPR
ncbi:hypothetical protein GCM10011491_28490 [Brucella endophytica]|uniref:DUF459 domain-containing protein n=1 Tax=Brucella endophytica TaxID=1963359 RepID=A0A916SG92_9HYPH|nr:DUF459 domain-containing protein [Brucella endophytica]GGA98526.1 hypothetical protein GCM10011491_28490 [Brucella endophytica]